MVILKKAFLFSLTSVLFIFLFGLIIFSAYDLTSDSYTDSVRAQANSYQSYYDSLKEAYIPIMIKISTRESLSTLINYSIENQKYVPASKFNEIMKDLLANGSADNIVYPDLSVHTINSSRSINYSLNSQLQNILSIYNSQIIFESAELTITPLWDSLDINQTSPWHVDITLPFSLHLSHSEFQFSDSYVPYIISVSILDLPDPLYGIESQNKFIRNITNSTSVVNTWNKTILNDFVFNELYVMNRYGTSFLMRLQNLTSASYPSSANMIGFINPYYLNSTSAPLYDFNSTALRRSFADSFFFAHSYSDCSIGLSQQDYLYTITEIQNSINLTFKLDFNSTIQYLGDDFSDSSEYTVSCSPQGVN